MLISLYKWYKITERIPLQHTNNSFKKIVLQGKKQITNRRSNKHEPKGITIIHEDKEIIVISKINGLLTVSTQREREKTAYYLLNEYVKKGNSKSRNRIYIVHRLDKDTSGILIFAKNEKAKRYLQDNWSSFSKTYYAVVHGNLKEKNGIITSYLTENKMHIVYSTADTEKGKLAKTGYKVLKESKNFSLLGISLFTGRKNQIRVHFSEKGYPVAGDKMYGKAEKGIKRLALHSASLTILHPFTKEKMTFSDELPEYFKTLVKH